MKNILSPLGLLVFVIATMQSCDWTQSSPGSPTQSSEPISLKEFSNKTIDINTGAYLSKLYLADQSKSFVYENGKNTGVHDARSISFPLEELKKYIAYIEQQARESGCADMSQLNLRIYYAKYPALDQFSDFPTLKGMEQYAGMHTIFFSHMHFDKMLNKCIDFDPTQIVKDCALKPVVATDSVQRGKAQVMSLLMLPPPAESGAFLLNHGSMAPPPDADGSYARAAN